MSKPRYFLFVFFVLVLMVFSGCGSKSGDKISFEKPERTINNNVYLDGENIGGMKETEILTKLNGYAFKIDIDPVNASINSKTWEVISGKPGRKLSPEKTMAALLNAGEGTKVDYVIETIEPSFTAKQLKENIRLIADYTTPLLNKSESRVNNIDIASNKINYKVLKPGEEFSFNKTVGRRSEAKGYEEAPIIVKTPEGPKKKNARGGGVCQISTTIYNAVEECKLEVVERHIHSKDVEYVPRGEDATVSYGTVDFRFINNRSNPIMLRVYLAKNTLTVKIFENSNFIPAAP